TPGARTPVRSRMMVTVRSAGDVHTCALLASGTVRCWGGNASGQIGDGTIGVNRPTSIAVSGLSNAVAIAAGGLTHVHCSLVALCAAGASTPMVAWATARP